MIQQDRPSSVDLAPKLGLEASGQTLFHALINASIDGVLATDEHGIILLYNEASERLFQHPAELVIGKKASMLIAPAYRAGFDGWVSRAMTTADVASFAAHHDIHGQRQDGTHFPMQVSLRQSTVEGRKIILAVMHDLTALYRERMAHDEEKAYLGRIVESTHDAIISYMLDGTVRSWNGAAERMFGYKAEEVVGASALTIMSVFVPTPMIESEREIFSRVLAGETVEAYESIRYHRDGTPVPVSISASPIQDAKQKVIGVARTVRDLREQRAFEVQRALLSDIVGSSSDAIISYDLDGTITSWNRAAEVIYGYRAEEMLGSKFNSRIPEFMTNDQIEREKDVVRKVIQGERVQPYETIRVRKDGNTIHVIVSVSPIRSADGTIVGTSRMVRDLSERKAHEKERAILNLAIESSDEAFTCIGLDGNILTWNRGAEKMLGYKAADLVGTPATAIIQKIVLPELVAMELENNRRALAGERIEPYRTVRIRKDGSEVPVISMVRTVRDSEGKVLAISRALHDMTERLAFEHQAALLSSIVESSNDAIFSKTLQGVVMSWNAAAETMFGYTAEEAIGKPITPIIPADRLDEEYKVYETVGSGGSLRHYETTRQRKDGTIFEVSISASPLRDADGAVVGISSTVRDITDRREYERRLEAMRDDMVHVARIHELGQVSAGIAHELNQPLAALLNYSNAARKLVANEDARSLAKLPSLAEKIGSQALRAGQIIRRMRDFVEKGVPHRAIEDLNTVAEDAVALALIGAKLARVEFHFKHAKALRPVLIDRIQIQQVLVNLLRNAVEAMSGSPRRDLRLEIANKDARFIEVRVSDSGSGISKYIHDRLFSPFVTTKEDGMGIGLAISKTIIEAHGGTLTAEPNPGGGTIFRFTLPAADPDQSGVETA